jgi:hypothetical protein
MILQQGQARYLVEMDNDQGRLSLVVIGSELFWTRGAWPTRWWSQIFLKEISGF